jgi:tetratricopeptide (TPR) repeat protein
VIKHLSIASMLMFLPCAVLAQSAQERWTYTDWKQCNGGDASVCTKLIERGNLTAENLVIAHNFDRAIEDHTKAIELDPNPKFPNVYTNRGTDYAGKGNLTEAIADFSKAIEINPRFADAYYDRALSYRRKGDVDRAIEDYSSTIKLNPQHAAAYNNRGTSYSAKGNLADAIMDFTKAIELNPGYANAYYNRSIVHAMKGERDLSTSDYAKAIELDPRIANLRKN